MGEASPYPVLDPAYPIAALKHLCAMAVMAKAPRPGKVKTRLSPPLTLEQTAALEARKKERESRCRREADRLAQVQKEIIAAQQ